MSTFVVMAESHSGAVVKLHGDFASRQEAEDYPVKLSSWKRVWVERQGAGEEDVAAADTARGRPSTLARSRTRVGTADREDLEARLDQIESALRDDSWVPRGWRLTATETAYLNVLAGRPGVTSKEAIHTLIYGTARDGGPEVKIVDVIICKLRKKVRPWGVAIETRWGQGYELDAAGMRIIKALQSGAPMPSLLEGSALLSSSDTRPIQPIALPANLRPNEIAYDRPDVRMANPLDLRVERAYQRDLSGRSIRLIRRIVAGWDWAKFKPPVCAETEQGLFVIDGQHTAIAAASHPDIAAIPIMVVPADRIEDRAGAFVAQNRDRVAMSLHQIFHAEVAAGVAKARTILAIAEKTGAVIPRSMPQRGRAAPGEVAAVNDLSDILGGSGEAVLERVLNVAVLSGQAPLRSVLARGLRALFTDPAYADVADLTDERIAKAIRGIGDVEQSVRELATKRRMSRTAACAALILHRTMPARATA